MQIPLKVPPPVLIWHGLGDQYDSEPMSRVIGAFQRAVPNLYAYSVRLDNDSQTDQKMSFLANMTQKLDQVCEEVMLIPEVRESDGVNLVGLSQGGLFVRSLVETCSGLKVKNIVTFGSPHSGIRDLPQCDSGDFACRARNAAFKRTVWDKTVQSRVVFAQYFRDVNEWDDYVSSSRLLAAVNNEREVTSAYKERLSGIKGSFVMYKFLQDTVVVPKESAWFCDWDSEGKIIDFEESKQYSEDLLGMKEMELKFRVLDSEHMRIPTEELERVAVEYLL